MPTSTPPTPKLVAPGEGKTVKLFGVRFRYKVESADSGGSLAVLEVEIPAGTLVKPHSHTREDEFSLVLAGTVGVRIGDDVLQANQGAYLIKPRDVPHAMWNTGSTPPRSSRSCPQAALRPISRNWPPSWPTRAAPAQSSTTTWRRSTASPSKTTGSSTSNRPTASSSDQPADDPHVHTAPVLSAVQAVVSGMHRVVTLSAQPGGEAWGEADVDQEPHAGWRRGSSRSRTASAAKRRASVTSSRSR